ncbi:MAG: YchJ family protein, partial [Planctomycetota bacterium]
MSSDNPNQRCPCHSGKKYKRCCRPWHGGEAAPTPEALMRSRYAAYSLGLVEYVMATTAQNGPRARPDRDAWAAEIAEFGRDVAFVGLEIKGTGVEGDAGWVHFRAILAQEGVDASFEERSGFEKKDGRW